MMHWSLQSLASRYCNMLIYYCIFFELCMVSKGCIDSQPTSERIECEIAVSITPGKFPLSHNTDCRPFVGFQKVTKTGI